MDSISFPELPRFELVRRIGAGGMGVVFEAYDREYEATVALKVLRVSDQGHRIQRFKNEFRSLQEIRHPNLIRFLELMEHEGKWFFTMELVAGVEFLEWVRPSSTPWTTERPDLALISTMAIDDNAFDRVPQPGSAWLGQASIDALDGQRLHETLRQLAEGLSVLHNAQKVHRDIKPSNILVDDNGKVIILDFGLAANIGEVESGEILGTPIYMAPEQAVSTAVGPEADWYSVGVMLFEALTGQVPFSGSVMEIIAKKREENAPAPSTVAPGIPAFWDELCSSLLQPRPNLRPHGEAILEALGGKAAPRRRRRTRLATDSPLLGRTQELAILQKSYDDIHRGEASTVFVYGESGLGKSELIREFGRALREDAVVLAGRCFERESVPYKAVDGVVDALANHLQALPSAQAAALIPRDAALLLRAFPVLKQVECFLEAPPVDTANVHPSQLRSRVFAALRELFARMAAKQRVLLLIDDLQWADQDSLDLMGALMAQPDAPPLMLAATIRTPGDESLRKAQEKRLRVIEDIYEIRLGPLSPDNAAELARRLADELGASGTQPGEIASEAGCHPLFIDVLLRYCYVRGREGGVRLNDALARHIAELEPAERKLLELLSVAGRPIPRDVAARAAQIPLSDLLRCIESLHGEKLVRSDGARNTDTIEPYHDRIREVASNLPAAELKTYYTRLALAFESEKSADPEALAIFWSGAGDRIRAVDFTIRAAEQASAALAYDRASRLYREAIRLREVEGLAIGDLWERLALSLVDAGRGSEAAEAFTTAAENASPSHSLELRRKAAEQLLRCGRIDDGIAAMRPVLVAHGFRVPESRGAVLRSFLVGRAMLRVRGLRFKRRAETDVSPEMLNRLDVCWGATVGLFNVDQLRGLSFHTKHLRMALTAGEPFRIVRGLAMEAAGLAAIGAKPRRIEALLTQAETLAKDLEAPYAQTWVRCTRGVVAYLSGNWADARIHCAAAMEAFSTTCSGVAWELESMKLILRWVNVFLGNLEEVKEEAEEGLRMASERGDLYAVLGASSGLPNLCRLLDDDPAGARDRAANGIAQWSQAGFHLQHLLDLYAQAQIDIYQNEPARGWERMSASWPDLESSGLLRVGLNRILMHDLRARTALLVSKQSGKEHLHKFAHASARTLAREKYPWARALAAMLEAQLAPAEQSATSFQKAAKLLEACHMPLHAAVARSCAALREGADQPLAGYFAEHPIAAPARIIRLLAPAIEIEIDTSLRDPENVPARRRRASAGANRPLAVERG